MDLVDLVDENDNVIGTIDRGNSSFADKNNVRGVELFLINKDGKIVIPKRSENRRIFPNCYDMSAAGMVDSGEDYDEAMYRELKEELNIDNIILKEIAYLNPYKGESNIFTKVYIGYIDFKIEDFDKDGISDIYYFTISEIDDLLNNNSSQFKANFIFSFNALKKYLNEN